MSKHTPGPWHVGGTLGQHLRHGEDTCPLCDKGYPLLAVFTAAAANPKAFTDTVHSHLWVADDGEDLDFNDITAADGTAVVGMYDYEEGGVCTNIADARLIAAAPDLLKVATRTRDWLIKLAESSENHAKDSRFPGLAEANAADAINFRFTAKHLSEAIAKAEPES